MQLGQNGAIIRPMKRIWSAINSSLASSVLGLILIGVAYFISRQTNADQSTANILYALGGIVLSAGISEAYTRESAKETLNSSLNSIARTLSSIAAHLGQATQDASSGAEDIPTVLYSYKQSTARLYGVVHEIQQMTGTSVDLQQVLATAQNVIDYAEGSASQSASAPAQQKELASLKEQVSSLQLASPTPAKGDSVETQVPCPSCATLATISLGKSPGASALTTCRQCGLRFHIHRRSDLTTLTKPWGAGARTVEVQVPCSNCQVPIFFRFPSDEDEAQIRFCLKCYWKMVLDPQSKSITESHMEEPLKATLKAGSPRSLLECPECHTQVPSFLRQDGKHYAICPQHQRLLLGLETE